MFRSGNVQLYQTIACTKRLPPGVPKTSCEPQHSALPASHVMPCATCSSSPFWVRYQWRRKKQAPLDVRCQWYLFRCSIFCSLCFRTWSGTRFSNFKGSVHLARCPDPGICNRMSRSIGFGRLFGILCVVGKALQAANSRQVHSGQ